MEHRGQLDRIHQPKLTAETATYLDRTGNDEKAVLLLLTDNMHTRASDESGSARERPRARSDPINRMSASSGAPTMRSSP